MDEGDLEGPEDNDSPGIGKFVKAGLIALFQALVVLFLAWLWWQAEDNKPIYQIERMINEKK